MTTYSHLKTQLAKSSLVLMMVMFAVVIAALIASGVAFSGFMNGGRTWIGLIQALLLCFGIGALVYIPAAAVFIMARHVRGNGPVRKIGLITAILALPYWTFGISALIFDTPYWGMAIFATTMGFYLSLWALVVINHAK